MKRKIGIKWRRIGWNGWVNNKIKTDTPDSYRDSQIFTD
jgi:hypothetical protein